jgi:hypothetical protein
MRGWVGVRTALTFFKLQILMVWTMQENQSKIDPRKSQKPCSHNL